MKLQFQDTNYKYFYQESSEQRFFSCDPNLEKMLFTVQSQDVGHIIQVSQGGHQGDYPTQCLPSSTHS